MANFLQVLTLIFLIPAAVPQAQVPASEQKATLSSVFGVFDKRDEPIPGLSKEQFSITDDGQPAEVVAFESSTKIPLRLGILIDSSKSSGGYLVNEKKAATFLAEHVVHSAADRAFVVAFNEVWDVVQDFTSDAGSLTQKIDAIKAGGGTAVWDVVYYACREKLKGQPTDGLVRRVIILLSDGNDNMSHVRHNDALTMALRAGVTVYIIAPQANRAEDTLRKLAASTGGDAFFPKNPAEWAAAVNHIKGEVENQYLVTYTRTAPATNAEFHNLKIRVNDPTLKVRSPLWYFSPKP
jgi:Ca-activated chloride channel family protein